MATTEAASTMVNGVNVDNLQATIAAIKATPVMAKFKFRIRNQWAGASRNRSTVDSFHGALQDHSRPRPFVLEADEPPVLLGTDLAANPVEHLLHALASCLTTSMAYHAAARGISWRKWNRRSKEISTFAAFWISTRRSARDIRESA